MPAISEEDSVKWRLINARNRPSQPDDMHFEAIEKLLPGDIILKLELLEAAIYLEARKLKYRISDFPPGPNSKKDIRAFERELDKDPAKMKLDNYLYEINKMMEFRVLFKAGKEACAYYEKAMGQHPEFLCSLLKICNKLISGQQLPDATVTWVFENRIMPILISLTLITLEELHTQCSDNQSNESKLNYSLKIILRSLKWLTVSDIYLNEDTLDQEILEQLLLEVFCPLLKKARYGMKHHLHVYRFGLNANFERHCRCSEFWYAPHLIDTLKRLSFHDPRILKFAMLQLDKVVDFSDTALDICVGSLIEGGKWEQVLSFLGQEVAPMFKIDDASKRHQACWIFNVCLGSDPGHIQDMLFEHKIALEELLADPCPAVRKEARLIWLKITLVFDNQPKVARILPQIVSKILDQEDYATLIEGKPDFLLCEGIVGHAETIKLNFALWQLLPIFQRAAHFERLPKQFYDNLLKFFPVGCDTEEIYNLFFRLKLGSFDCLYESSVWSDGSIKATYDLTTQTASLRLYLDRPDLPTKCYTWLDIHRCNFRMPYYPRRTYYPKWVPSATVKLFELLKRVLDVPDRKIDVRFAQRMILLSCTMMDRDIIKHPCCGINVSHHIESAKMLELLTIRVHQQGLHDKISGRTLEEMIHGMDAREKRSSWGESIQTMTIINFIGQEQRKSKYKSVYAILEQLNFDCEPQGIHNKRILLMLISKYIVDFKADLVELKELVPMAISLCARLITAYKLRREQEYCADNEDCLPTCIELAFPTSFDEPTNADYQCEFVHFRNSLDRIDEELMQQIVESLDEDHTSNLPYYRNSRKLVETKESGYVEVKFQCLGHYYMLENLCKSDHCPLLSRKFERKKAEENTFVWLEPSPPPPIEPKQLRSSKRHKTGG